MVILNITMAKQGLRENSESESGLPCDRMFGRLYSSFHCMGCAVLRLQYFIVVRDLFNRTSGGYTILIHA